MKKAIALIGSIVLTLVLADLFCWALLEIGFASPSVLRTNLPARRPVLVTEYPQSLTQLTQYMDEVKPFPSNEPLDLILKEPQIEESSKGFLLKKNFSGAITLANSSGTVLASTPVTTDAFRRRSSKPNNTDRPSDKHFLLLGCSYAFGVGVPDSETLSWKINDLQTEFEAYNNGVGGFGIGEILRSSQSPAMTEGITQRHGTAVYIFIASHLARTIHSTQIPWAKELASFTESPDGVFTYDGSFEESHPLRSTLYRWLAGTHFFRYFDIHLPLLLKSDYARAARMVSAIKNEYLKQTDAHNGFIVAIYPELPAGIDITLWREALATENIDFIDYSITNIEKYSSDATRVPYDGHPNGKAHEIFARVLVSDVQTYFRKKDLAVKRNFDTTKNLLQNDM